VCRIVVSAELPREGVLEVAFDALDILLRLGDAVG
jgi:hypothetical protein